MAKTFDVEIDGVTYTLRKFNLGQLERVTELYAESGATKAGFQIFKMAFENVTQVDGVKPTEPVSGEDLTPDMQEFKAAMEAILEASGMKQGEAAKGEAQPAAEAPAP